MRGETGKAKLGRFMEELGNRVRGTGGVYLTGGGTAVWEGWRQMTIDIDIKASPEPTGYFEAIAELKELVDINVELASPDDFIPELAGWRERSLFVGHFGKLDFFHYDLYSQALAKLERGHGRDLTDVGAMLERGLVSRERLWGHFLGIEDRLIRYPAIEPVAFRASVLNVCQPLGECAI